MGPSLPARRSLAAALFAALLVAGLVSSSDVGAAPSRQRPPRGHVILQDRISPAGSPVPSQWLQAFNYYRGLTTPSLRPVIEYDENVATDAYDYPGGESYTYWDEWHAVYMTETQDGVDHQESSGNAPWYDQYGHEAAQNSNLAWTSDITATPLWAIEGWMTAPFHGLAMLDPGLVETGFGFDHKSGVTFKTAAGVDVGHDSANAFQDGLTFPIKFPGNNKTIFLDRYNQSEQPNPFGQGPCTSYDGTQSPSDHTGPPIYLIFGPSIEGDLQAGYTFKQGSTTLPSCAFDGNGYGGPFGTSMELLNAIFLFPKNPLKSEKTYTVSIPTTEGTTQWSFKTGDMKAPKSRIGKPDHQTVVDQDNFEKMKGTSTTGDTARVDVAIAQLKSGKCRFRKGDGSFTSARDCFQKPLWFKANGKADWAYPINKKLPPSTGSGAGFSNYVAFSRARDEFGNIETNFPVGRNNVSFHISP